KLLKDLKELAEYDQSTSTDRPIFLNDNEDHHVQNRESPENYSEETVVSKTNQEPPQNSDIHQLIEECSIEVLEEQKQNMEKTMFDLVKICHHKQFLCMHDNVDDLIKSALDSKLLSINSINSQRLDKKEQEVKIVEEQPAERRNLAPILSTKEPKKSLSMGECKVTSEDKRECDELVCDNHSDTFSDSKIDDDISVYDDDFEDIEYVEASLLDPEIVSIEEENGVEEENVEREEEKIDLEDISQVQDVVLHEKLFSITCLISNIESLNDNSTPDRERLINLVKNDNSDSSNNPLLEEADLFLSDDSIPPELLINDSILSHKSFDSSFEENPLIPRPPPEPHDDNFDLEPEVISAVMEDNVEPDEYFNPGGEIFVSTNNEDVDYFPFMFVIRIFLPYLILLEISPLFLSTESEDTIFDPGLSPEDRSYLVLDICPVSKIFISFDRF
nr:hypothetical protein [Tanacetum cinerariifolium]